MSIDDRTNDFERRYAEGGFQDLACAVSEAMWGGELGWANYPPNEFIGHFWRYLRRIKGRRLFWRIYWR